MNNNETDEIIEMFEERAAIMEYDGEMLREDAEKRAWDDVLKTYLKDQVGQI